MSKSKQSTNLPEEVNNLTAEQFDSLPVPLQVKLMQTQSLKNLLQEQSNLCDHLYKLHKDKLQMSLNEVQQTTETIN